MILFLILTALTVSIDSFFCGLSLSFSSKRKLPIVIIITLTVFFMCLIANYFVKIFSNGLNDKSSILGGLILIAVGIYNFSKKDKPLSLNQTFKTAIISGFAVGLDGAIATISLSLMSINGFFVPITIAITHGITIYLGTCFANSKIFSKNKLLQLTPPLLLVLLGCYKILTVFVQ